MDIYCLNNNELCDVARGTNIKFGIFSIYFQ